MGGIKYEFKDLHNKTVVASIDNNLDWVTYKNGYKDVYINGILVYSDGESCVVTSINNEYVVLKNKNIDNNTDRFEIPISQFKNDFIIGNI